MLESVSEPSKYILMLLLRLLSLQFHLFCHPMNKLLDISYLISRLLHKFVEMIRRKEERKKNKKIRWWRRRTRRRSDSNRGKKKKSSHNDENHRNTHQTSHKRHSYLSWDLDSCCHCIELATSQSWTTTNRDVHTTTKSSNRTANVKGCFLLFSFELAWRLNEQILLNKYRMILVLDPVGFMFVP